MKFCCLIVIKNIESLSDTGSEVEGFIKGHHIPTSSLVNDLINENLSKVRCYNRKLKAITTRDLDKMLLSYAKKGKIKNLAQ